MKLLLISLVICMTLLPAIIAYSPPSSFTSCNSPFVLGGSGRFYYYAFTSPAPTGFSDCVAFCASMDNRSTVAIVSNPLDLAWAASHLASQSIPIYQKIYIGLYQTVRTFEPDYGWTWLNREMFHSTPFDDGRTFQLGPNGAFMDFANGDPADFTNPSCGYMSSDGNIYELANCGGANGCLCSIPGR
jgi:hypothetical protein